MKKRNERVVYDLVQLDANSREGQQWRWTYYVNGEPRFGDQYFPTLKKATMNAYMRLDDLWLNPLVAIKAYDLKLHRLGM